MFDVLAWCQRHLPEGRTTSSGWWRTRCPYHDDSTPSFAVNLTSGAFGCRAASCGAHGGLARLVHDIEQVSWATAFRTIDAPNPFSIEQELQKAPLPRDQVANENAWPSGLTAVTADQFPTYLLGRRYGIEDAQRFSLHFGAAGTLRGYLVFPIFDIDGNYVTYKARRMADDGMGIRYTGPTHSLANSLLYGAWLLRWVRSTDVIWVVEGQFDVLRLWQLGVVAVGLSTAIATPAQRNQLVRLATEYGASIRVMLDYEVDPVKRVVIEEQASRLIGSLVVQGVAATRHDLPAGIKDPDLLTAPP